MSKRNKNKIKLAAETPTIVETTDIEHVEGKTYYVKQEDETWRVAEDSDFGPEGAFVAGTIYGEEVDETTEEQSEEPATPPAEEPVTPPVEEPTPPEEGGDTPDEKDDEEEEQPKRIFETHKSCKSLYCVNIMRPRRSRFVKEGE